MDEEIKPQPREGINPRVVDAGIKPIKGLAVKDTEIEGNVQKELVATEYILPGEKVGYVQGYLTTKRTRHSITDTRNNAFIQPTGMLGLANHHCDPNTRIEGRTMYANKLIAPGDKITWDYRTTEATLSAPFDCKCGAPNCCGRVEAGTAIDKSPGR